MGEDYFHEVARDFLALFKNNEKIDMKKLFQMKVWSSTKT